MQLIRFVRALIVFVILGLAGSVLGCSGEPAAPPPPDPEASKKIAAQFKADKQAERAARQRSGKGR